MGSEMCIRDSPTRCPQPLNSVRLMVSYIVQCLHNDFLKLTADVFQLFIKSYIMQRGGSRPPVNMFQHVGWGVCGPSVVPYEMTFFMPRVLPERKSLPCPWELCPARVRQAKAIILIITCLLSSLYYRYCYPRCTSTATVA